jgi:hypothetical protein
VDEGAVNTEFSLVSSYSGSIATLTHVLTPAGDSLTLGLIYSLKFRSLNPVGYSAFSEVLRVGLGSEPPAITTLRPNIQDCGPSFVAMEWDSVTDALSLSVLGYVVQMIDPISDEWVDVLDASQDPDRRSHIWYGAVTGETYTFRVFAVNFNGRSSLIGN